MLRFAQGVTQISTRLVHGLFTRWDKRHSERSERSVISGYYPIRGLGVMAEEAVIKSATKDEKLLFLQERGFTPVTVNSGCILYYKLHGKADAPQKMMLINGTGSCGHYSDTFVALLLSEPEWESKLQICCFDVRGSGQSSDPSGMYTTAGMSGDCTDLMDHLEWERAHVLGMSLGGMIAQELALRAPARVVTLCLVVTTSRGAGASSMTAFGKLTANIFDADSRRKLIRSMKILFSSGVAEDPESDRYRRLFAVLEERVQTVGEPFVSTMAALGQAWAATTHYISKQKLQTLKGFRIPTVVLGGTEDHMIATSRQSALAEALECKYAVIEGGHALLVENPSEAVKVVSDLMQQGSVSL
eukprot:m.205611 g.205611  ORF g.205611 m.205611 type:complete len:359 (+) comp25326_c2_seq5:6167-7243(+)